MLINRPIRLQVLRRKDFFLPVCAIYLLVVIAALMSSQPVLITALAILTFALGWFAPILSFSKANNVELTLVIFADGRVQLESIQGRLNAGILDGQQWCTRHLAVLRISDGDTSRNLLVLSSQQQDTGDFRRLNMWLRQELCINASVGPN